MINIISIFVLIILIGLLINGIEDVHKNTWSKSFDSFVRNTDMPIIAFENNGKVHNFVIDTGASLSLIDARMLPYLEYNKLDTTCVAYGIDGNKKEVNYVKLHLTEGDMVFQEAFQVMEDLGAFDNVREAYGITITGLLGLSFLEKYGAILDLNSNTISIKKK